MSYYLWKINFGLIQVMHARCLWKCKYKYEKLRKVIFKKIVVYHLNSFKSIKELHTCAYENLNMNINLNLSYFKLKSKIIFFIKKVSHYFIYILFTYNDKIDIFICHGGKWDQDNEYKSVTWLELLS